MLDTLIESRPHHARSPRATAGSLLAHCAVVVAVIAGTWRASPAAQGPARIDTLMVFEPRPVVPQPAGGAPRIEVPEAPPLVPDFKSDVIPVPQPEFPSNWVNPPDWTQPAGSPEGPPSAAEPIAAEVADERPELLTGGGLRYPEFLRTAGVTGKVIVEAVIDTLGRAERASLQVVSSAHPGFRVAALAYVGGALFRPGRVLGRAVRVRVRVPIEFRLTR